MYYYKEIQNYEFVHRSNASKDICVGVFWLLGKSSISLTSLIKKKRLEEILFYQAVNIFLNPIYVIFYWFLLQMVDFVYLVRC